MLEIIHAERAHSSQAGLEGRSYQGRRHPFAGDIADSETEPMRTTVEEVVEISASVAGLDANGRIRQTCQLRQIARKQPRTHPSNIFQFLDGLSASAE